MRRESSLVDSFSKVLRWGCTQEDIRLNRTKKPENIKVVIFLNDINKNRYHLPHIFLYFIHLLYFYNQEKIYSIKCSHPDSFLLPYSSILVQTLIMSSCLASKLTFMKFTAQYVIHTVIRIIFLKSYLY